MQPFPRRADSIEAEGGSFTRRKVGKGNRVRARVRGRVRFRNDCEVGEIVFRSFAIRWYQSIGRVLVIAAFIPANLTSRQSSNRFRSGIVLVLLLGSLPPYRPRPCGIRGAVACSCRAPSGLVMLECVSQGKPWAKLSWPFGPKTRLQLHPSFRQMSKLQVGGRLT